MSYGCAYLRGGEDDSKGRECVVEELLVHLWVQVADEDVGTHVQVLLMRGGLVHPYWLPVELDHVHDLDGVVSILFSQELHEAVALFRHLDYPEVGTDEVSVLTHLVHHGDPVLGHVDIDDRSRLHEELPQQRLIDLFVQAAHVDRRV